MVIAHLPAGYITAWIVKEANKKVSGWVWWAIVAGSVFPDLDLVLQLIDSRAIYRHRMFLTHKPVMYLGLVLLVWGLRGKSKMNRLVRQVVWGMGLGVWVHLVLDSYMGGVMWLWPVSEVRIGLVENPFSVAGDIGTWLNHYLMSIYVVPELLICGLAALLWMITRNRMEGVDGKKV